MRLLKITFAPCLIFFWILASCKHREGRTIHSSFYYWKTVFRLSAKERETLQQLSVHSLYVKFFDVEWNPEKAIAQPAAKSIFQEASPEGISITPVVFITQEPLQKSTAAGLDTLAANISKLLSSMAVNNHVQLSTEVQLDCDWTTATKEAYFHLLDALKNQPFFQQKILSATIRLHQLKFLSQTGVPPVNKGLLMCYNMGNLRYPQTKNSIIEEGELKKYISNLDTYPLPLDVALPIFDWYILFDGPNYKGLVRDFLPSKEDEKKDRIVFTSDTTISGYVFKKGQWLRHEQSNADVVKACAELLSKKMAQKKLAVLLYHLDEKALTKYSLHELESFYNSLR